MPWERNCRILRSPGSLLELEDAPQFVALMLERLKTRESRGGRGLLSAQRPDRPPAGSAV